MTKMNDGEFKKFLVECYNWIEHRYVKPQETMYDNLQVIAARNTEYFTDDQRALFRRLYNVARKRVWHVRDYTNALNCSSSMFLWFGFCKNRGELMRFSCKSKKRNRRQYQRSSS